MRVLLHHFSVKRISSQSVLRRSTSARVNCAARYFYVRGMDTASIV